MSFDQTTRNRLQKFVTNAKSLLTEEFTRQIQNEYGLDPTSGHVATLEDLSHLDDTRLETARLIRETLEHYTAGSPPVTANEALDRIIREQAFTVLNRLCALRMAEARGFLIESVGAAYQSKGFQLYVRLAGPALGETGDAYRSYLFSIFDEFALDLNVLFDRFSREGRLFPKETTLLEVLDLINDAEIRQLWTEDETIGWIYQYFNSAEERRSMRASQAPRTSRELAVRNQFFTPRFVVEYLTNNTLGALWYQMRDGATDITTICKSMVSPPGYNHPHTPKKDPRDLKILDPACGSGHFLLYAFDVLESIYLEAWLDPTSPLSEATGNNLQQDYEDQANLKAAIPELILRWNLHGVDIDPRAAQIAALALWLRAQRSWHQQNIKPADRPAIRRSNIVCAEGMPGSSEVLTEFADSTTDGGLTKLLEATILRMKYAGELGSLLHIEAEIDQVITAAKKKDKESVADSQHQPTDEEFWQNAEQKILDALRLYGDFAEQSNPFQKRLFADDVARGFAFVDVSRKRFDVVLMNPPFGLGLKSHFEWLKAQYPEGYVDIYCAFILRAFALCTGRLGAITSRSWLVTKKMQKLRSSIMLPHIECLLDLGTPVMDGALVESCAFVLDKRPAASRQFLAIDRRNYEDKSQDLADACVLKNTTGTYLVDRKEISKLPQAKILYQLPQNVIALLQAKTKLVDSIAMARQGMKTFDDLRFLRLRWEVSPEQIGPDKEWEPLSKGGPFALFYADLPLVVRWQGSGEQLCEVNKLVNGQVAQARQASEHYRKSGGTYSRRSSKDFGVRALPAGCIIGEKGPAILPKDDISPLFTIGLLNSRFMNLLVHIQANAKQYDTGIIDRLPATNFSKDAIRSVETYTAQALEAARQSCKFDEVEPLFCGLPHASSIDQFTSDLGTAHELRAKTARESVEAISKIVDDAFAVDSKTLRQLITDQSDEEDEQTEEKESEDEEDEALIGSDHSAAIIISYCIGVIFGRWDARMAIDDTLLSPLNDPFAPICASAPAALLSTDGFPAGLDSIASTQWLRNRRDGKATTTGAVDVIRNEEYPLPVQWNGILVHDATVPKGSLPKHDIVSRIRETIDFLWKDTSEEMERELCSALSVADLDDFIRKPSGFFQHHLKAYSKSRRQAPIYWPLSTSSGSYTLWLYYPRLNDQTLYLCVNDFIDPKIGELADELTRTRDKNSNDRAGISQIERLEQLVLEMEAFKEEILRIARLPWRPNLNDGVQITASILWNLFAYKPWQKKLQATWKDLQDGDYDWSHIAYTLWPERVKAKCEIDRSIAIAHGLTHLFKEPAQKHKVKV